MADIAESVIPAVVSIEVRVGEVGGTGSGVVIEGEKGYIVTNNHVVSGADGVEGAEIRAVFSDGSGSAARIVGRDPASDIAVLKVEKPGLVTASLGSSDDVVVGDPVVAIGSPLGLAGTVTSGIVSALERPVRLAGEGSDTNAVISAVQTDAPINPGNSGGALVDASGAVIGINTAIASVGGGSVGLGFAIPVDTVRDISEQLIATGEAVHASLGLNTRSVTDGTRDGALVLNVEPGSAAAAAGSRSRTSSSASRASRSAAPRSSSSPSTPTTRVTRSPSRSSATAARRSSRRPSTGPDDAPADGGRRIYPEGTAAGGHGRRERRCSTRSGGARSSSWPSPRSSSSAPSGCPGLAKDAATGLKRVRSAITGVREQVNESFGDDLPELRDLDLRKYHPKTFIRSQLLGDDEDDGPVVRRPPPPRRSPGPATTRRRRPFDPDAT